MRIYKSMTRERGATRDPEVQTGGSGHNDEVLGRTKKKKVVSQNESRDVPSTV